MTSNDKGSAAVTRSPVQKIWERPAREDVEKAVHTLLLWAGDDPDREGLVDTPARVANAYEEWFAGYKEDPEVYLSRTFEEVEGYDEMVVLRDIRFESHCEHHISPIIGRVHIGYLPNKKVVGISKLARVVEAYARRLQVQEKFKRADSQLHSISARAERGCRRNRGDASMHDHARRTQNRRYLGDLEYARCVPPRSDDTP